MERWLLSSTHIIAAPPGAEGVCSEPSAAVSLPHLPPVARKLGTRLVVGKGPAAFVQNTCKHLFSQFFSFFIVLFMFHAWDMWVGLVEENYVLIRLGGFSLCHHSRLASESLTLGWTRGFIRLL